MKINSATGYLVNKDPIKLSNYQKELINKLSIDTKFTANEIVGMFINAQLNKIFPKEFIKIPVKIKPPKTKEEKNTYKMLNYRAKKLKLSKNDIYSCLLVSYILGKVQNEINRK